MKVWLWRDGATVRHDYIILIVQIADDTYLYIRDNGVVETISLSSKYDFELHPYAWVRL